MKITKNTLKQLIAEELASVLNELEYPLQPEPGRMERYYAAEGHEEIILSDGTRIKVPLMPGETTSHPAFKKRVSSMMRARAMAKRPTDAEDALEDAWESGILTPDQRRAMVSDRWQKQKAAEWEAQQAVNGFEDEDEVPPEGTGMEESYNRRKSMKISKQLLKQLIKEELQNLTESR